MPNGQKHRVKKTALNYELCELGERPPIIQAHKVLITRIFRMAIIYMKASIQPKLGTWSLDSLVRDPNGAEFKEFLEIIRKNVLEFERIETILEDQISISEFQKLHT